MIDFCGLVKRFLRVRRGILLVGVFVLAVPTTALGQQPEGSAEYVQRVARRMAHEVPARITRRRVRTYDRYIRYFAGLSYTRQGITVSANFVRALMAAESGGRPKVVSGDGAIGLLQIMPETGQRAARKLYSTGYNFRFVERQRLRTLTARDLKDPAVNILIGCYLLDRYNKTFGDNLARTVGAWNAGPDRVSQYGSAPPYDETLELIGRVNAYYQFFLRHRRR